MKKWNVALLIIATILSLNCTMDTFSPLKVSGRPNSSYWSPWNVTGTQRLVVITVEFKDMKHTTSRETITERIMNMSRYFEEISYGKISVNSTIFADEWKVLNESMSYYGEDDLETGKKDKRSWDFVGHSMKAWQGEVDFSQFDCLIVIHAGEDQSSYPNQTDLLWRQNYCSFRRTRKRSIRIGDDEFNYWGFAYDSEFEQWGLIAHEFGHSLGLPDLYDESEKEEFIDGFSIMGRGDRLGWPEGTCPSQPEGWSKIMLGWITPIEVTLKTGEEVYTICPLDWNHSLRAIIIPISNTTCYIIEVRCKTGYDSYLPIYTNSSVLITYVNNSKRSGEGIVTIHEGGLLQVGQLFKDLKNRVFILFEGFNGSRCRVKLSFRIASLTVNFPDCAEAFSTFYVIIFAKDSDNESVPNLILHIVLDDVNYTTLYTNELGEATVSFNLGIFDIGCHHMKILSSRILTGQVEGELEILFPPWLEIIILVLAMSIVLVLVVAVYTYIQSKRRRAVYGTFAFARATSAVSIVYTSYFRGGHLSWNAHLI